ncbi:phosphotransferase family enzyme [Krasilnikovia cinnamomea]|uniref:Phosphotransferase family enzyme n=1 Tax=Krasilnikovia cinnamomea TaxID=349313 RepID=A0A4Q7ZKG2_9ACTN|nr:aminoglycoside phosphotransferase family protein [Krasilnikovia cinnamomea]RZU51422.1 phosphotransferase family enzyme [Krasilnikovia cinnamomea]
MFVEERSRPVLFEVCRLLGLRASDAVLLRHHSNAVYGIDDVVVKIAPGEVAMGQVRSVVALVRWLTRLGFPTVPLSPALAQPIRVAGHAVTVWERLDPAHDRPVTTAELGSLLHRLHSLPLPEIDLPDLRPLESIHRSLTLSEILDEDARAFLFGRLESLGKSWSEMTFPRGNSLIQTDPQTRNALRRLDGTPVLADWDGAGVGPREWDIATIAVHCRRFGLPGAASFADFTDTYGWWDVESWESFESLCRLRELQMIATNARKCRPGTSAAAEVLRRVEGLQADAYDMTGWRIL